MSSRPPSDRAFWLQWVGANLLGEFLGLGLVGAIGYLTVLVFGEPTSLAYTLVFAVLAIGLGAAEGMIVGYAQTMVLRRRLPQLRSWISATVVGAVAAWTLGVLPSTVMSFIGAASHESSAEISDALQLLLAAPMGMVAGAILGFPQWLVLRRYVSRAGWWLPANALAWGCGMPLVFFAAGAMPAGSALSMAVVAAGSLAATGAVVGAVHGGFLVWLLASANGARNTTW